MKQGLQSEKKTTHQEVDELIRSSYESRVNDLPLSIRLAEEALEKANALRYVDAIAKIKNHLSLFYFIQCDFERSLSYAFDALEYCEAHKDLRGIALAKYNIGSTYYRTDNFSKGLIFMLQSLKIFEQLNDYHNQARVLKSTGTVYEYFQDYANAETAYKRCVEASRKVNDLNSESYAYNPLSGLYLKQNRVKEAMDLIELSIRIKKQTGDKRGLSFAIYGRSKVLVKQNKLNEAEADLLESLQLHKDSGDQLGLSMTYNKLGQLYFLLQDYARAEEYLKQALNQSLKFSISIISIKAYYQLYLLEKKKGRVGEAFVYLENYLQLKERVINSETLHVIRSYEEKLRIETLELEAKVQREKREIIEAKNDELDSFFYRVSHDLKGPISSLQGLYNLVKLDVTDPVALPYFEMYRSQVNRIHSIVMGLINLTQMKHLEAKKEQIEFYSLVNECIASYGYLENFKRIKFIIEIQDGIEFFSEWTIVNTILQNLIENAIKYSGTLNPFVKIQVIQDGEALKIMVEDNGHGIDEVHQSKIFDMFYRANLGAKGSGLGLYILKRAVERLNGKIQLKSQLHKGSEFTVTLPIH
jgi:signal transduction histidine kinase